MARINLSGQNITSISDQDIPEDVIEYQKPILTRS